MRRRLLICLLLLSPALAAAAPSEQVPVGVRAIGMGGAFTAIADDATSVFWNPAGMPFVGHQEVAATHANLFGSDVNDNLIAFLLPLTPSAAAAVDWYHSGFDDSELGFAENRVDLSYGMKVHSLVSAGLTAKYLGRRTQLDGATVRHGGGAGADFGVLVQPLPALRLGAVLQDAFGTHVDYSEGGSAVAYPRNLRAGVSYRRARWGTLAVDVDDRFHLGAEATPFDLLSLRGGIERDRHGESDVTWSTGIGIKTGIFRFDYANQQHPTLGTTHHFGLAMEFNFNPSQVRIEKVEPRDLYGSLYKTYAREPIAKVSLRNTEDRPLSVTVRTFAPDIMSAPSEQTVELYPKSAREVALTADLSPDKLFAQAGGRRVSLEVSTTYQSVRLPRTDRSRKGLYVYGPGAISWSDGADQAAAFVTTHDPVVDRLAGEAARIASLLPKQPFGPPNLAAAAAVVDALGTMGIAYVPDPVNPFSTISEVSRAVDTIRYPRETLRKLGGDCDDTTVLLAALLENIGISTRFVDGPGHIFLLFDSGLHERNRLALSLDERLSVVADQRVWIPLETTAFREGFAEAWRLGAEQYARWARETPPTVVDVEAAAERYEPGEPPPGDVAPAPLDAPALTARLLQDDRTLEEWKKAFLAERYGEVEKSLVSTPEAWNELAFAELGVGDRASAHRYLDRALAADSASARTLNNLGVVQARLGDPAGAVSRFESALAHEPGDPGIRINLGLALRLEGEETRGRAVLEEGVRRAGGLDAASRLLGGAAASRSGDRGSPPDPRALLVDARQGIRSDRIAELLYWKR